MKFLFLIVFWCGCFSQSNATELAKGPDGEALRHTFAAQGKRAFEEAIEEAEFEPRMVSDADDVGIIQKRIIQNVYDDPIIVCDVSGKNPNVMFELGMRLAFDKPTIIIKDDKTSYTFDTSPIEHIGYPRDLRFALIVEFKKDLANKIRGTYEKASADKEYTTFLKHFGSFSVAKIETKPIPRDEFILDELRVVKSLLLRQSQRTPSLFDPSDRDPGIDELAPDFRVAVRRAVAKMGPPKPKTQGELISRIQDYIMRTEDFRALRVESLVHLQRAIRFSLQAMDLPALPRK